MEHEFWLSMEKQLTTFLVAELKSNRNLLPSEFPKDIITYYENETITWDMVDSHRKTKFNESRQEFIDNVIKRSRSTLQKKPENFAVITIYLKDVYFINRYADEAFIFTSNKPINPKYINQIQVIH